MDPGEAPASSKEPSVDLAPVISELQKKHQMNLQNLTLTTQPFRTLQLFILATLQYLRRSLVCIITRGGVLLFLIIPLLAIGLLFTNDYDPQGKHIQELTRYAKFMLWWVALGIASSIGLGSGLHTFVLYLGPHIAFFTIKATQCGRVDLKSAPYDTIQFKSGPSWLEKHCSDFGAPVYPSLPGSRVRVSMSSILPHVQLEAFLWGLGTALGELPPFFISRAARSSENKVETLAELDPASSENGVFSSYLKPIKRWLLSQFRHLNFFTILLLASVPNPLFDLAGITCGHFGIPFWKFFLATMIGKAIIKTHIQSVFIISLFNNEIFEWLENKLILIPGFPPLLTKLVSNLNIIQEKYLPSSDSASTISEGMAKRWNLSFTLIWNSVIWLVLINFLMKIVDATAQGYLKKQQDLELTTMVEAPKLKSVSS
ncbi:vacuole membrane protein KMS1-like [Zingiber officinale]|uniref:Vacuole membrane protein KMS1 n=1 Tax=Zingiber officinale TaxID=94328 RepID=A0A8J5M9B3_ZINOF|nr:vacuole membrane protein KMS1-like [Zingiber officinale]KAG6537152.1 hypothetical protein ZIOFF_002237 [Zingiber officinale]